MNKNVFKSIGAVLAGFITVFILSIATDIPLEEFGIFPPQTEPGAYRPWMLLLALIYRSLYGAVGGYVTAALAPREPMRHAILLGLIGIAAAVLGAMANWDKAVASGAWYPIALILLTLPSVWLGGRLKVNKIW